VKRAFRAQQILSANGPIIQSAVLVEDGIISAIISEDVAPLPNCEIVDFGDTTLAPAYFDQHVHGGGGHDVMEANEAALGHVGRFLAQHGVAGYLATTVTASLDATLKSLSGLAKLIANERVAHGRAVPVGIHLEGPFLSHEKRGVHSPELLLAPTIELFDRFWQASEGQIKLITIAPELPNAIEVITHASGLGVRVSLGHSNATAKFAKAGVAAGGVSATHTFNAMRSFDHREPGILGVVLDEENLFAEIISDGYHVDPSAVRLFWKAKGADRTILVTDGISATGMPDGMYKLGTLDVEVKDGKCLSWDDKGGGTIAGSTLTMDRAVSNFHAFTGAPIEHVAAIASGNSARMLGIEEHFGSLAVGRRADFVVLDADGSLQATVLGGELLA
jgi:N-acetylglucosamine-6-phosphate deacetylase